MCFVDKRARLIEQQQQLDSLFTRSLGKSGVVLSDGTVQNTLGGLTH